jgi:crotonobetaine/carnitine-CoA ligase
VTPFPETIPALFEWRAARRPSATWLFYEGDSWTFADVDSEVDRFAVGLAERGVVSGDRVGIVSGNHPHALFTWLAANRLGAIACFLNPALKAPELRALAGLVRPRLVAARDPASLDQATFAPARIVATDELARSGRGAPVAKVSPDDTAVLIATSGTTGTPKAVAQSHRTYTLTAEAFPAWMGLDEHDRLLAALPLFHINAQAYSTMGALGAGATLALLPKFSASRFWNDARRLGATELNAVGAMVNILLATERSASEREHSVRLCYAALALPEARHREVEERFGLRMLVGYGMSETTFGTVWPLGDPPRHGTIGKLRQHPRLGEINAARVVGDDGSEVGPDETGELWLKNPACMSGYFDAPEATASAFEDGWLRTGDLVRRDAEGTFTFVSRKKDIIRRRGENISAAEIELALLSHPEVSQAAAVAAASSLGEDDIVAWVALCEGSKVDPEALKRFLSTRLADFKIPSTIHVRDALPLTPTARVAKHLLK